MLWQSLRWLSEGFRKGVQPPWNEQLNYLTNAKLSRADKAKGGCKKGLPLHLPFPFSLSHFPVPTRPFTSVWEIHSWFVGRVRAFTLSTTNFPLTSDSAIHLRVIYSLIYTLVHLVISNLRVGIASYLNAFDHPVRDLMAAINWQDTNPLVDFKLG